MLSYERKILLRSIGCFEPLFWECIRKFTTAATAMDITVSKLLRCPRRLCVDERPETRIGLFTDPRSF